MSALEDIAGVVGGDHVLTSSNATARYNTDEHGRYRGRAAAVVRPGTRAELSSVLTLTHANAIGVVPQGGNTGYCAGATPDDSGTQLVVSLERLNRVIAVDTANATLGVEAGVILGDAQAAAARAGLLLPLSMGSQGSCQIGGNLSTNAGGLSVLRYGTARDLVLGLEVVLPDGRVLNQLRGLRKDNTGYDLKQLFIGAEGTLGIISAATLKLYPLPRSKQTVFAAVSDAFAACALLAELRRVLGDNITSFEYLTGDALELVTAQFADQSAPFDTRYAHYVLIEWSEFEGAGTDPADDILERLFSRSFSSGLVFDAVVAHNETQRQTLWRLRESVPAAEKMLGGSIKHDVAVLLGDVPTFIEQAKSALTKRWPTLRLSIFGHIGDGNVHFNVLPPAGADTPQFIERNATAISDIVHGTSHALGGSFSAEHGVGVSKRGLLARYAGSPQMDLMRSIKAALDPDNLMNPGKVL